MASPRISFSAFSIVLFQFSKHTPCLRNLYLLLQLQYSQRKRWKFVRNFINIAHKTFNEFQIHEKVNKLPISPCENSCWKFSLAHKKDPFLGFRWGIQSFVSYPLLICTLTTVRNVIVLLSSLSFEVKIEFFPSIRCGRNEKSLPSEVFQLNASYFWAFSTLLSLLLLLLTSTSIQGFIRLIAFVLLRIVGGFYCITAEVSILQNGFFLPSFIFLNVLLLFFPAEYRHL